MPVPPSETCRGSYTTQSLTAEERHTAGGTVDITATGSGGTGGDIVMMQGAAINFSGGGIVYGAGALNTTVLVSGTNLYTIGSAPTDIRYDSILNGQTFTNSRFGITDEYDGVYYGGAFPVNKYSPSYTVGSQCGHSQPASPAVVLDGTLFGRAYKRGPAGTRRGPHELDGQPIGVRICGGPGRNAVYRQYGRNERRRVWATRSISSPGRSS